MQIAGLEATDQGSDVLLVKATVDTLPGRLFRARGWVSALVNHYDTDEQGQRPEGAKARPMTTKEQQAYCTRLLAEQNPELAELLAPPEPKVLVAVNAEAVAAAVAEAQAAAEAQSEPPA